MKKSSSTFKTPIIQWGIIIVILFLFSELFSFTMLKITPLNNLVYKIPSVEKAEFDKYIITREVNLGWPDKAWISTVTSNFGERRSPANQKLRKKPICTSVYGDSFAFSEEVDHEFAWPNKLADILGCRVLNFGVGGYGTDQALLKFESHLNNGKEIGDSIILTLFPDNLNRNVNQWRYLLSGAKLGFKPVFRILGDNFNLEPLSIDSYQDFLDIANYPENYLVSDFFSPDKKYFKSKIRIHFPYTITIIKVTNRLLSTININRLGQPLRFLNYPAWYDTRDGVDLKKIKTLEFILKRYEHNCLRWNHRCYLVMIPDPEMLLEISLSNTHNLDFIKNVVPKHLMYIDLSFDLFRRFGNDFCNYYTQPKSCSGHFNEQGYSAIASILSSMIAKNDAKF